MSRGLLKRSDVDRMLRKLHDDHPIDVTWPIASALVRHAYAADRFAPEEPTDEEINAGIAKAQGWEIRSGSWSERVYVCPGHAWKKLVPVADYQPVSNLGQALEAAAALWRNRDVVFWDFVTHEIDRIRDGNTTAADAARAIATHLYRRLGEREG